MKMDAARGVRSRGADLHSETAFHFLSSTRAAPPPLVDADLDSEAAAAAAAAVDPASALLAAAALELDMAAGCDALRGRRERVRMGLRREMQGMGCGERWASVGRVCIHNNTKKRNPLSGSTIREARAWPESGSGTAILIELISARARICASRRSSAAAERGYRFGSCTPPTRSSVRLTRRNSASAAREHKKKQQKQATVSHTARGSIMSAPSAFCMLTG